MDDAIFWRQRCKEGDNIWISMSRGLHATPDTGHTHVTFGGARQTATLVQEG